MFYLLGPSLTHFISKYFAGEKGWNLLIRGKLPSLTQVKIIVRKGFQGYKTIFKSNYHQISLTIPANRQTPLPTKNNVHKSWWKKIGIIKFKKKRRWFFPHRKLRVCWLTSFFLSVTGQKKPFWIIEIYIYHLISLWLIILFNVNPMMAIREN